MSKYRSLCPVEMPDDGAYVIIKINLDKDHIGRIRTEGKPYKTLKGAQDACEKLVTACKHGPQYTYAVMESKLWNTLEVAGE